MAEGPPSSLNDFFKKDKKKKIKASNLNSIGEKPAEEKKEVKKAKPEEDDGWHEEEVVQATMKVEVAGKLVKEEEKDKEEEAAAPAWGVIKYKVEAANPKDEKKYPSLAKSVASSAIHLEDKSGQVNISTSKNIFASLENDDDDDGPKRPKDIKPALVSKKKGEREKDAIQREVSKYKDPKDAKKEKADDEEEDEDKEVKLKKNEKKAKPSVKESSKVLAERSEAEQIQPDHEAIKAKYIGRAKLPKKPLPQEELEEEKENKPQRPAGKKKKWAQIDEEDEKRYVEEAELDD